MTAQADDFTVSVALARKHCLLSRCLQNSGFKKTDMDFLNYDLAFDEFKTPEWVQSELEGMCAEYVWRLELV